MHKHRSTISRPNEIQAQVVGKWGNLEKLKDASKSKDNVKNQKTIRNWLSSALRMDESAAEGVVQAHIKERCVSKNKAEKKFKTDVVNMIVYSLFIVLFSLNASSTNELEILNVRNMVEPVINNFSYVAGIDDIYTYLDTVVIPAVSSGGLFTLSGNVMMTPVPAS